VNAIGKLFAQDFGGGEEPEPLVVDLAAARRGVAAYLASCAPVRAYLAALLAIELGERPLVIDGQTAGRYDPLAKQPEAKAGLQAALSHGKELGSYLDTLHGWAHGGMAGAVDLIVPQVEVMRDVLQAIPSGAPATPEQARRLAEAMNRAGAYSQLVGVAAEQMREGVIAFLGRLVEDNASLAGGRTAVAAVIHQVEADATAAAQPYILSPLGRGIGEAILGLGRQLRDQLRHLDQSLGQALQGHAEMGGGISALGSAVETIAGKYAAAQRAISRAGNAELPAVVRKLEPAKALVFWHEYLQFIESSGL